MLQQRQRRRRQIERHWQLLMKRHRVWKRQERYRLSVVQMRHPQRQLPLSGIEYCAIIMMTSMPVFLAQLPALTARRATEVSWCESDSPCPPSSFIRVGGTAVTQAGSLELKLLGLPFFSFKLLVDYFCGEFVEWQSRFGVLSAYQ